MRSLWVKLIGAFGLVILVGIGVVVVLASQATRGQFELYVTQTGQQWADRLAPILSNYYAQTGSWEGAEAILQQPTAYTAPSVPGLSGGDDCMDGESGGGMMGDMWDMMGSNWENNDWCQDDQWMMGIWTSAGNRLVLVNEDRVIEADTAGILEGTQLEADDIARGTAITSQGERVGTIIVTPFNTPSTPAGNFLGSVSRSVLWAGIAAGIVALVLGSLLFFQITRPLRSLSAAAQSIAKGDLSKRAWIGNHDEVGQVARSFNQMADKLQNYEAERQNMTADIAHELRTPLSVIQGNLEAMLDNVLPASAKELALLHQETILLNRLISDLRTLSLADAGQLNLRKHPVNLAELIDQAIERLQLRVHEKGINLRTDISADLLPVQADPERLSQVLTNLVDNALRYTYDGTQVVIAAGNTTEGIQVSVTDDGPGIPEEELPNLFDRFWRAEKSRNRMTGGSGLGLAIVKQLVTAHGGSVWAENLPGAGIQFNFTVPG
ncbi:MAG: HAMP domain-containing protein [Chloroflexi bacterium]|nr:MAG: HAMP domain-containing protein [Chloroflexota bacterium]